MRDTVHKTLTTCSCVWSEAKRDESMETVALLEHTRSSAFDSRLDLPVLEHGQKSLDVIRYKLT